MTISRKCDLNRIRRPPEAVTRWGAEKVEVKAQVVVAVEVEAVAQLPRRSLTETRR